MSRVEENLSTLGESLPVASKPVANYLGCKRSGNTLYVSGRVSQIRCEVGADLSVAEAQIAAKGALLDILAIIKDEIGNLDKVVSVEKLVGFVRSAPAFTEQTKVIHGASDLLVALFGEDGRHAKTATGVAQLPFGAAVQLDLILRMAEERQPDQVYGRLRLGADDQRQRIFVVWQARICPRGEYAQRDPC